MARLHATRSGRWKPVGDANRGSSGGGSDPGSGNGSGNGSSGSPSDDRSGGGDRGEPSMDALLVKRQEGVIRALRAKESLLSDTVSALRLQREEEQEELRAEVASLRASLATVRGEYAQRFAEAVEAPAQEWVQAKAAIETLQTGAASVEVSACLSYVVCG